MQIQNGTLRSPFGFAPPVDILFRPEEKHCGSRKDNILPPKSSRYSEVHRTFLRHHRTIFHFKQDRLIRITIRGIYNCILLQGSSNAQSVPDTICKIRLPFNLHAEGSWYTGKRGRHADSRRILRFWNKKAFRVQSLIRLVHLII